APRERQAMVALRLGEAAGAPVDGSDPEGERDVLRVVPEPGLEEPRRLVEPPRRLQRLGPGEGVSVGIDLLRGRASSGGEGSEAEDDGEGLTEWLVHGAERPRLAPVPSMARGGRRDREKRKSLKIEPEPPRAGPAGRRHLTARSDL